MPRRFKNRDRVRPMWDDRIRVSPEKHKDRSSPKPDHGYAYFAEPWVKEDHPAKYDISNPKKDRMVIEKAPPKKVGKLRRGVTVKKQTTGAAKKRQYKR